MLAAKRIGKIANVLKTVYGHTRLVTARSRTLAAHLEISFGEYGGAECYFFDVDGDGKKEIITYQGPGIFGTAIYRNLRHIKPLLPQTVSVSAFRLDGTRLWTWGRPNPIEKPYI